MTTKNPKTLWWWLIVFNKQQHISTVSRQMIASVTVQVKSSLDGADWCLIGIVVGVRTTKNIPQYQYYPIPVNIAQYPITQYQYHSNPRTQGTVSSFTISMHVSDLWFIPLVVLNIMCEIMLYWKFCYLLGLSTRPVTSNKPDFSIGCTSRWLGAIVFHRQTIELYK